MELTLGPKKLAGLAVVAFGVVGAAFTVMTLYRSGQIAPGCQPGRTITIAPEHDQAGSPKIWKEWVVWDESNLSKFKDLQDTNVFAYNVSSGQTKRLAGGPSIQSVPEIHGTIVAWHDAPADRPTRIKAHNLSNGMTWTLPFDLGSEAPRGMWKDRLLVEANSGLYVYNFTSKALTLVTENDTGPVEIWEDRVVWTTWNQTTNTSTLFLHDLASNRTQPLLTADGTLRNPDIFEDLIVYERDTQPKVPGEGIDLFVYDLEVAEESGIPEDLGFEAQPRIAGDWVAYRLVANEATRKPSVSHRPFGVYAYNLQTEDTVQVSDAGSAPDVWQDRVVYMYADVRTGRTNVRLTCLGAP